MSNSERPSDSPNPDSGDSDRLAQQARAAADQAIELARLAQEQAKLARELNAQAAQQSGQPLPEVPALDLPEVGSASNVPRPGARSTHPAQPPVANVRADAQPQAEAVFPDANLVSEPKAAFSGAESEQGGAVRGRRKKGRNRSRRSVRDRINTWRKQQTPTEAAPAKVKIRVKKGEEQQQREEGVVPFFTQNWNSMAISGGVLAVALFVLTFLVFEVRSEELLNTVMASFSEIEAVVEEEIPVEEPLEEPGEQQEEEVEEPVEEPEPEEEPEPVEEPAEAAEEEAAEPETPEVTISEEATNAVADPTDSLAETIATEGSRSESARAAMLKKYGGTAASESAVQHSLDWFSRFQRRDGSWSCNAIGKCANAGDNENAMGATSYVLLAYLGAGQTHREGKYKRIVKAGLEYLLRNAQARPAGADFRGLDCREHDNFYVQGAAALALCELFAMTRDRKLRTPAERAIQFIVKAQDPQGGGWRYAPREPGSTSATGVQLLALKSAKSAGFRVPPNVFKGISHYLDTVRSDGQSGKYGYRVEANRYSGSSTAIALLCRMYLGWGKDNEELARGVEVLDKRGPYDNLYYCYYATQVMHHWGGEEWERWNEVMREDLIRTQVSAEGTPEYGSWTPRDQTVASVGGGRLFMTCLATMTLEVYYRYLPLYEELEQGKSDESSNQVKR